MYVVKAAEMTFVHKFAHLTLMKLTPGRSCKLVSCRMENCSNRQCTVRTDNQAIREKNEFVFSGLLPFKFEKVNVYIFV